MNLFGINGLNPQGTKRFIILSILWTLPILFLALVFSAGLQIADLKGLVVLVLIPIIYYASFKISLSNAIEEQVMAALNFKVDWDKTGLQDYDIKNMGEVYVDQVFSGEWKGMPLRLVIFNISVRVGNNTDVFHFMGAEFTTQKENMPVRLYDKDNNCCPAGKGWKLESDEFNNRFAMYSDQEQNVYYQLDPDTMADLLDLREKFGDQINIETKDHKALVYTSKLAYDRLLLGAKFSFVEVLNGEKQQADIDVYQSALAKMLDDFEKMFKTLDLAIAPLDLEQSKVDEEFNDVISKASN